MTNLTTEQLIAIFPYAVDPATYAHVIQQTWDKYGFKTKAARAAFCGIINNETGGLREIKREIMNYSPERAIQVFTKARTHFEDCKDRCARGPVAFANWIYADIWGNGPESSGDGWNYRGGGMTGVTFRPTYKICGESIGVDLINNPDRIGEPLNAAMSAGWFMAVLKPSILRLFNTGEVADFVAGGAQVGYTLDHDRIRLIGRQRALDVLDGDPPTALVSRRLLHFGVVVGDDVMKLQRMLKDRGLYIGEIDGDFGNQTREAVLKFQRSVFKDHAADVDGVVGDKTWSALETTT